MKYTISIDFASKLGFSIWSENDLISFDSFNFQDKDFKKQFKDQKFQQGIFDKIIFFNDKAEQLIENIFNSFQWKKEDEFDFIVELSDFGFKYSIENITRLFTVFCLQLKLYSTKNGINNLTVNKIIAVQWRAAFKKNNQDKYDWNKYIVDGKKTKKLDWKAFAVEWIRQYISKTDDLAKKQLQFNNDVAEAILIGYTWKNYMKK